MTWRLPSGAVAALLLLAGCALPQRQATLLEVDATTQVVAYPADLRGAYLVTGAGVRMCAEPAPDIALASTEKLTGALTMLSETGQKLEASAAADLAAQVVTLAGRSSLVLLARELLYRGCELTINHPGDAAAALALYERVADLVEALGRAEQDRAAADAATARRLAENGAHIGAILGGGAP